MTRLVAVEVTPDPQPVTKCGRLGCAAPATVTTVLLGKRRTWELHHCAQHPDGPGIAQAAGFMVLDTRRARLPEAS